MIIPKSIKNKVNDCRETNRGSGILTKQRFFALAKCFPIALRLCLYQKNITPS